jgi:hypothetical protein
LIDAPRRARARARERAHTGARTRRRRNVDGELRYSEFVPGAEDLVVIERDAVVGVGLYKSVFAMVWRGPPTVAHLRALGEYQRRVTRLRPRGFVTLAVLPSKHTRMSPEVRAAAEELARNPSPALVAVAQVITGDGFVAATTRMIAAGMALLAPTPTKLFASRDAAALWLCERAATIPGAPAIHPEELIAAVAAL